MAIKYLKKSPKTPSTDDSKTNEIVKGLLKEIEISKEEACIDLTKKFDNYDNLKIFNANVKNYKFIEKVLIYSHEIKKPITINKLTINATPVILCNIESTEFNCGL